MYIYELFVSSNHLASVTGDLRAIGWVYTYNLLKLLD